MNTLVLLSGGTGLRMHNSIPKQYMLLAGKPVIMHILERCDQICSLEKVIVVCSKDYQPAIELMVHQYNVKTPIEYAEAGESRQASVFSGLKLVKTESVIIHEAARPFVGVEEFNTLINTPDENVMYGAPIPFTVLKGHDFITEILTRSELVNVQLPQKFNTKTLYDAHEKAEKENKRFTEDASQVFFYYPDLQIRIIDGKDYNIKITTPTDMITGELIYKEYFAGRK